MPRSRSRHPVILCDVCGQDVDRHTPTETAACAAALNAGVPEDFKATWERGSAGSS